MSKKIKLYDLGLALSVFLIDPLIIMMLWNWFVIKLGIMSINYSLALGLALFVNYMILKPNDYIERTSVQNVERYIKELTTMILVLMLGFIVHLFV